MGFEIEMRGIPEEKINKWVPNPEAWLTMK
jgi:hypothetical protein